MRLLVLLTAISLSGTAMAVAKDCPAPAPADAIAAVRLLNQQYIDAARSHDAQWFRAHMAEDVLVVLGAGRRLRKPEFLSMVMNEPKGFKSLTVRDVTLRAFGPTVQVDADAPWELAGGDKGVSRYIDTYAWLDCRWQVISAQITLLPKPAGT